MGALEVDMFRSLVLEYQPDELARETRVPTVTRGEQGSGRSSESHPSREFPIVE